MIDGSIKHNHKIDFELQSLHIIEERYKKCLKCDWLRQVVFHLNFK